MTKFIVIAAVFIAVITILTGCGHNAVQYSDGVGVEIGFIPDQYKFALNFRYGKIFSAVVKEKTKVSLQTDAENSAESNKQNTTGKTGTGVKTILTLETGDQTTGYVVDKAEIESKYNMNTNNITPTPTPSKK